MAGPILVTGATGRLGAYVLRELASAGVPAVGWSHSTPGALFGIPLQPVELADADDTVRAFRMTNPSVVIHAAAIALPKECDRHPERAERVNVGGSRVLAELADRMVFVSTDLVFDGERGLYKEDDPVAPLSLYGRTKVEAERAILAFPRHSVVRVNWMFGPPLAGGRPSFFDDQVSALKAGSRLPLFHDERRSPLGLVTAARALVAVARSQYTGVLHVGGPEPLSRLKFGQRLAGYLNLDPSRIIPTSRMDGATVPRPRDTSFDSSRWRGLFPDLAWPTFEESMHEMAL
ncbi:MAG TPA: SDR family oxidoreductase [Gemmataceae bacterium]|nr:SDR family oxidoreductase [Gemmataceae bacterium]